MSYEEESYMVLDEGGDFVSQHVGFAEAEDALKNHYFKKDCEPDTSIGHGDGASVVLVCSVAALGIYADEFYEMKPTPEYQRIQEELKQGREAIEKLKQVEEIISEFRKESNTATCQVDMGYMACVAADRVVKIIKKEESN